MLKPKLNETGISCWKAPVWWLVPDKGTIVLRGLAMHHCDYHRNADEPWSILLVYTPLSLHDFGILAFHVCITQRNDLMIVICWPVLKQCQGIFILEQRHYLKESLSRVKSIKC